MAPPKTPGSPRGTVHGSSAHGIVTFTVRASPLPPPILEFLQCNASVLRRLLSERVNRESHEPGTEGEEDLVEDTFDTDTHDDVLRRPTTSPENFWADLDSVCQNLGETWSGLSEKAWAFGPNGVGGCVLVDARKTLPLNR